MVSNNTFTPVTSSANLSVLACMGDEKAFREAIEECELQDEMAWQMTRVLLTLAILLALLAWLCPAAC
ncbi:hypothetical protein CRV007 [Nile crocodilepox virus]|uniref:Uncharacterized protein n=1 Tax=Nile crocodilepox virus (isolate Crocodylus niloticus/Zimbabwe/Ume/2001) TaxID=1289473 RepID=Q06ZX3_CPRVZ|nr:hypothetical protein CRV007 [Nile crocodilepox virus]ABJ08898.1 hypothetical protein CRV007 [Nile crocodilepox virus]